jgi:hypothetical protein
MIEVEILKAQGFRPPLAEYLVATTEPRDARLQEAVRLIDGERRAAGRFAVGIVFWEDLWGHLAHTGSVVAGEGGVAVDGDVQGDIRIGG